MPTEELWCSSGGNGTLGYFIRSKVTLPKKNRRKSYVKLSRQLQNAFFLTVTVAILSYRTWKDGAVLKDMEVRSRLVIMLVFYLSYRRWKVHTVVYVDDGGL